MMTTADNLNQEIIDDLHAILGDGFGEIVEEQTIQALEYLQEIARCLKKGKAEAALRYAHSLKSSTGQIGLQGIYSLTRDLEKQCREDVVAGAVSAEATRIHTQICEEFGGAVGKLRRYLATAHPV